MTARDGAERGRAGKTSAPLRVSVIGPGRVGCSMARYLGTCSRVEVVGFYGRTPARTREACGFAGGIAFATAQDAVRPADLVLVTTPDAALADVWDGLVGATRAGRLELAGKVIAHCSGATPSSVFAGAGELGALVASAHPLYAVSSRFDCWRELGRCWFALEGDDAACRVIGGLLQQLGNHVARTDTSQKQRYHAAAVMASNLVVALYDMAAGELGACGFGRNDAQRALAPLFLGNAEHIARAGTRAALTGPAARGDVATIEGHLSCLDGDTRETYRLLTRRALQIAGNDALADKIAGLGTETCGHIDAGGGLTGATGAHASEEIARNVE